MLEAVRSRCPRTEVIGFLALEEASLSASKERAGLMERLEMKTPRIPDLFEDFEDNENDESDWEGNVACGSKLSGEEPLRQLTLEEVLKRSFGHDTFRGRQKQIIMDVLKGKDALAVMPTGGGKSLLYELPARILPGRTVVVSPLIALMQDQEARQRQLGLKQANI